MPPPASLNSAWTSIKYHVHQWVSLVLYNSIYQNLVLLYLYRILKFFYGWLDHSTELSRICGSGTHSARSHQVTPLDKLWDEHGHATSGLVHDRHLGMIAFTSQAAQNATHAVAAHVHLRGNRVKATPATTAATTTTGSGANASASRGRTTTALQTATGGPAGIRSSTDSARSTQSSLSHDSGSEEHHLHHQEQRAAESTTAAASVVLLSTTTLTTVGKNGTTLLQIQQQQGGEEGTSPLTLSMDSPSAHHDVATTELKHRKKRRSTSSSVSSQASSLGSSSNHSNVSGAGHASARMDLRQSRSAAGMIYRIDRCILFSKQLTLERRELEQPDCDSIQITQQILRKKRFPDGGSPHTPAARKLQYALDKIASTHQLAREINQRVHTKYDSTNPAHERKLLLLWDLLRPHEKLDGRYTKQWTEIGFQGKDPATDFRGMGMLGLDDLVYYAKHYPQSSKHALECSHDEVSWYSFAIVGINITAFAVQTLRTRQLQYYLFLNGMDRSVYHELYCYLFHRFNSFWNIMDPKPSVMDFERVFADFKLMMERQLARRKLMMLRFDTSEDLGSGGYPISHQVLHDKLEKEQQQQQRPTGGWRQQRKEGDVMEMEMEAKKSK